MNDPRGVSRRSLLRSVPALGAALAAPGTGAAARETMKGVPFARHETVRIGFIGLGGRGSGLLGDLLHLPQIRLHAVCDLVTERAKNAARRAEQAGQKAPEVYGGSERIFEKLCARDDLDIVYIATPWDWHVPMALCAMEHGHHAATEVPAATTLADCWKLVDTSERTRRHCVILENCCYGYTEMLVKNLVKAGLLGEITHGEAAYIHNLRGLLLADSGEGLWRREPHIRRNANLYPTHGLGPVAQYMDIHRGDRFETLVSFSSRERALTLYRDEHTPAESPKRREKYLCGDMNSSLIRTAQGRTILLQHDVVTPRPYTRHNLVQGTKGTFADYPPRICVDGQPEGEAWVGIERYKSHEDPLWQREGETARKLGGHGGMDFLMNYRLIECLRQGLPPEMDVYDAAAWSAPFPLSELSVARGGTAVKFPDFTRGRWQG